MLTEVTLMAAVLVFGNIKFRHFDPFQPLWRRLLKSFVALAITVAVSRYFGKIGVVLWFLVVALPVIYVHGFWLPRHGVNGWTGEPREKYYALKGWPPPKG